MDFYFQPNKVIATGLTLATRKLDKIYVTTLFRYWTIVKYKTMIYKKQMK